MKSTIAIVTGASRGIGQAIATELSASGFRVFNLDREAPADSARIDSEWVEVDLANIEDAQRAIDRVLQHGAASVLVNNAALGGEMSQLEALSPDDMDRTFAVNVRAPAICAQRVIPAMRSQNYGRIINISSRAHLGKAYRTAYGGGKGALVSMTRVWAIELAAHGITCNAIAPGPVRTELFEKANPPDMPRTQKIIDAIPLGRLGEPEDIANAVAFFAGEAAGFITGQVLYVCGGTMLTRGGS